MARVTAAVGGRGGNAKRGSQISLDVAREEFLNYRKRFKRNFILFFVIQGDL